VTLLLPHPELEDAAQVQHSLTRHLPVPRAALLPTSRITYEGLEFPAPRSPEAYLRSVYGYLGTDAVYNKATGLYEKRSSATE